MDKGEIRDRRPEHSDPNWIFKLADRFQPHRSFVTAKPSSTVILYSVMASEDSP